MGRVHEYQLNGTLLLLLSGRCISLLEIGLTAARKRLILLTTPDGRGQVSFWMDKIGRDSAP